MSGPSDGATVEDDDGADSPDDPEIEEMEEANSSPAEAGMEEGAPVFCNQCGWENPPGATYCSRCGEELQDLSDAGPSGTRRVSADLPSGPDPEEDAPEPSMPSAEDSSEDRADKQSAMGRQIALVVGGALVLILGLFFVTQWSSQYEWERGSSSGSQSAQAGAGGGNPSTAQSSNEQRSMEGAGPREEPGARAQQSSPTDLQALLNQSADSLTGPIAGQIDSLRTRIERASGAEKRQLQAELVNLYIGAGHPDRAAVVQKNLADATGAVDAQRRAADLLYRWMQKVQGQGQREQVFQVARHAAQAYEKVANQRPDDLDARTRMGEAYLLTNKPMKGIKAINAVLEDDSTFVPARFQKGLALLQINRLDQATTQFEMVRQYAEDGSPFSQQAERALKVIKEQRRQASSGSSTPAPETNR